jgi:hypothetical protein
MAELSMVEPEIEPPLMAEAEMVASTRAGSE